MIKIKLIKDYNEYKAGKEYDVADAADAQRLIKEGFAEEVKLVPPPEIDVVKLSDDIVAKVRAELKMDVKIPAQAKDSNDLKRGPFKSAGDFYKQIVNPSEKLFNWDVHCKASGMSEGVNADGGFLIPPEWSMALLTALAQAGVLAPRCQNFAVNNNLALPYVNLTTQATSWTGGCTVYKMGEGVAKTSSKPALAKAELKLHKRAAVVYATDELLADSAIALETFLTTMVSTEMALTKDEDIVNGTGAAEPLGIMNAPCLITVAKETGQVAATILYENVLKMWKRLYSRSVANAIWLINQDCVDQIASLVLKIGTAGGAVFALNTIPTQLLGIPIVWSPHCQTLGTAGDIILGDLSQYITISKAGSEMETATSIHVKFLEDEMTFRFVVRFDGQPWWSSAVTPKHGTSTISPFVALATRS